MRIYCVNTNKKYHNKRWRERFFYENRVFTCCLKQLDLDLIEQGDLILAYHNDKRVVGVGVALEKGRQEDNCKDIKTLAVKWLWYSLNKKEYINLDSIGNPSFFNATVIDWTKDIDKVELFKILAEKISKKGAKE